MTARRVAAAFLALIMTATAQAPARTAGAQPATPPPYASPGAPAPGAATEVTPARVSYLHGDVSFWRPGAEDWGPARLNTPLAPGDTLYAGPGATVEIQMGARAFVRAGDGAQLGIDNQEPDFLQLRLTSGHAALDLRQLAAGSTVEVDTPNAAFTVERAGYYHLQVEQATTTFRVHRGGGATVTPVGASATVVAANQQAVVTGTDLAGVAVGAAPPLTAWDQWNYQRSEYLGQAASARHVAPAVYGTEALDQHGTWRTVETYGPVWVPTGVAPGWAPYSTGRWIWDPRFGWTWLDDAPWGWAPYHYGRWVLVGGYWAWAPGPIIVRPAYAPALVVFLGGLTVSLGRPLCWAPLGWGEPVIPWWGRHGFAGVPWWGGWGGPRVVNNVVIDAGTTVNVTNIIVYKNVHVTNAVVGVRADRFGHGRVPVTRIGQTEVAQLRPVHGAVEARPVPASVMPAGGPAVKPPPAMRVQPVVATRPAHDPTPALREQGLAVGPAAAPATAPHIVPPPKAMKPPAPRPRPGTVATPGTTTSPALRRPEAPSGQPSDRMSTPSPGTPTKAPSAAGRPSPSPLPPAAPKVAPPTPATPTPPVVAAPKASRPRPARPPGPPPAVSPKVTPPGATARPEPPAVHGIPSQAPAKPARPPARPVEASPRAGQVERGQPPTVR